MTLTDLLKQEAEAAYHATEALIGKVDANTLNWKPATGSNWMTVGQVLEHMVTSCCGSAIKGFVSGDWGLPPGMTMSDMKPEDMLPPAEKMGAVKSLDEARSKLAADKKLALEFIDKAGEANLLTKRSVAPWGGPEVTLFQHIDHMIDHLRQHHSQLFYYLKLQGKPVHTGDLWGM
jgi:uncharacterized damage-inducible protein DinB